MNAIPSETILALHAINYKHAETIQMQRIWLQKMAEAGVVTEGSITDLDLRTLIAYINHLQGR